MSTHGFEKLTHEDSGQSRNEGVDTLHIKTEAKLLNMNDQESTHDIGGVDTCEQRPKFGNL